MKTIFFRITRFPQYLHLNTWNAVLKTRPRKYSQMAIISAQNQKFIGKKLPKNGHSSSSSSWHEDFRSDNTTINCSSKSWKKIVQSSGITQKNFLVKMLLWSCRKLLKQPSRIFLTKRRNLLTQCPKLVKKQLFEKIFSKWFLLTCKIPFWRPCRNFFTKTAMFLRLFWLKLIKFIASSRGNVFDKIILRIWEIQSREICRYLFIQNWTIFCSMSEDDKKIFNFLERLTTYQMFLWTLRK